jgi:hypothetical protein
MTPCVTAHLDDITRSCGSYKLIHELTLVLLQRDELVPHELAELVDRDSPDVEGALLLGGETVETGEELVHVRRGLDGVGWDVFAHDGGVG